MAAARLSCSCWVSQVLLGSTSVPSALTVAASRAACAASTSALSSSSVSTLAQLTLVEKALMGMLSVTQPLELMPVWGMTVVQSSQS